jgi:hypothetical protein
MNINYECIIVKKFYVKNITKQDGTGKHGQGAGDNPAATRVTTDPRLPMGT